MFGQTTMTVATEDNLTPVSAEKLNDITSSEDTLRSLREQCKKSLFFLCRVVLGYTDFCKEIHLPACRMLQDYRNRRRRLLVLPRTWFKSTMGSVGYPIWRAIDNQNVRILIAQNTMTNAKKKIMAIKGQWDSNELLRALFPELLPRGDAPWSSECLTINRSLAEPEGTYEGAGTATAVVSRHYDEIIEDDTVAPDFDAMTGTIQQPTNAEIEKAIGFHKMCYPLLLHPKHSVRTVIGTRWAHEDLIGWILKNSPGYSIYTRSALEKDGHGATREQGGQPIWDRFDMEVLDELASERGVGQFMFETLYLNSPTGALNKVFKREMLQYYDTFPSNLLYCTSTDPSPTEAIASTADTDFTTVVTTALDPSTGEVWIVHYDREHCDPGRHIDLIFNHARAFNPLVVKVESVAYQRTLKYWIERRQEKLNEYFYIEQVPNAKVSKNARIMALHPWFSSRKIRMRTEHSDMERELIAFDPDRKSGGHDDLIDALSMQVSFWSRNCKERQEQKKKERKANPFSGQSIVDELLGRAELEHRYPYDMGLMRERLRLPRDDYAWVGRN